MPLKIEIIDGSGSGASATVTKRGELVTGRAAFSTAFTVEANVIDTAFNFVGPIQGQRFVISDILISANRSIGVNDAEVVLYEAIADDTITVATTILEIELAKNGQRDLTGLNLIVSEGVWVNIKTNDATIFATVMGYYVRA